MSPKIRMWYAAPWYGDVGILGVAWTETGERNPLARWYAWPVFNGMPQWDYTHGFDAPFSIPGIDRPVPEHVVSYVQDMWAAKPADFLSNIPELDAGEYGQDFTF